MKKKTLPMNLQFFADGNSDPAADQNPQTGAQEQSTQQQANQNPTKGNEPEGEEKSLEVQIAELRAANAKLKSDNDKLCTSEGNLRKQLREKLTAEEREAEAKAEQQAQHDEYVKGLERFKSVTEAAKRYVAMGMDSEMAEKTAAFEVDGDMASVTANMTQFMKERDKKHDEELRDYYQSQMPTPQSGNQQQVDYSKQIQDSIASGDDYSAIAAMIQQANANGGGQA